MRSPFLPCVAALIAACGSSTSSTGTGGGNPPDTSCATGNLASASQLVSCIRQDDLWAHMQALQQIADANPGPDGHASRNSGEPGYLASVNYAADLLRSAGYRVTIQQYTFPYASVTGTLAETSPAPQPFAIGTDFDVTGSAGSGDATAQLQPAGGILVPAPQTPNSSSSGCSSADFTGFVAGRIALIQRGNCLFDQKVANAVAAGAAGVIIFNEGSSGRTGPSTCSGVVVRNIPVICETSYAVGAALYNQALQGAVTVHCAVQVITDPLRPDYNLIAESPHGDTNRVVVVDAHLDAIYGAGMLDNGSGSVTILDIALQMAKTNTRNQLRYIWFGGEELGLYGSFYYTSTLPQAQVQRLVFDVDADVTATPNYVYAIADPANSSGAKGFPANVIPGSQVGNNYFISYFTAAGLPYESRSSDGTDSYAFGLIGVPNSGILTGQDCCKSSADVAKFGGYTGNYEGTVPGTDGGCVDRPFLWCDNLSNNDPVVLTTVSKAFASVVYNLANDSTLTPSSTSTGQGTALRAARLAAWRAAHAGGEGPER